jgi:hypothetical protein
MGLSPLVYSPDGKYLAGGGVKGPITSQGGEDDVQLWDVEAGELKLAHPVKWPLIALGFTPDSQTLLAFEQQDGRILSFDVAAAKFKNEVKLPAQHLQYGAFSHGGRFVIGCIEQPIVFQVATGKSLETLEMFGAKEFAISADDRLAVCDDETHIHLWSTAKHAGPPATGSTTTPPTPRPMVEAEFRTWTSADGKFTVEAQLVKVVGKTVHLKRKDGKTLQVPLDKLGDEDQTFLKSQK